MGICVYSVDLVVKYLSVLCFRRARHFTVQHSSVPGDDIARDAGAAVVVEDERAAGRVGEVPAEADGVRCTLALVAAAAVLRGVGGVGPRVRRAHGRLVVVVPARLRRVGAPRALLFLDRGGAAAGGGGDGGGGGVCVWEECVRVEEG